MYGQLQPTGLTGQLGQQSPENQAMSNARSAPPLVHLSNTAVGLAAVISFTISTTRRRLGWAGCCLLVQQMRAGKVKGGICIMRDSRADSPYYCCTRQRVPLISPT